MKRSDNKKSMMPKFLKLRHPTSKVPKTFGQKASDILTKVVGSWWFILILFAFIFVWIFLNVKAAIGQWDPWPFIILNLTLSCIAAIQLPILLMSQNREGQKDRLRAQYDYAVNRKSEREITEIKKQLNRIEKSMMKRRR